MGYFNDARTDQGEVLLNPTAQGYYTQLIAICRKNVLMAVAVVAGAALNNETTR